MAGLESLDWFAAGRFVDSKDTSGGWLVAKVIEENPATKQVRIRYDGWSEKWDAMLFKNSSRLAPFRKYSRHYTGQSKFAIRDWSFSAEEIEATIAKLASLVAGETLEPIETTQFLRGHVFTLVDCLLVSNIKVKRELELAYRLFTAVIDFAVEWLKKADTLFPHYYAACSNLELYMTNSDAALACIWPELIFTLVRLFGKDERTSTFHRSQTYIPSDYEPAPTTKSPHIGTIKATAFHLNYFAKVGGFEALMKILREERDNCKVPIELVAMLRLPEPNAYMAKPLANELHEALMQCVTTRLASLTAKEIKDMDREQASLMLANVSSQVAGQSVDFNPHKFVEDGELSLSLKFFQSPYLEKRIRGLNDLKDMVERVKPGKAAGSRQARYLTGSTLAEWILEVRLIETIFGENPHIELVKRASEFLGLLAQFGRLTNEHLEMIWSSNQGKHDSLVRVLYQAVLDLAPRLTIDQSKLMFSLIKEVPLALYDEKYLKLVKDFSAAAIDIQSASTSNQLHVDKEWFGLQLLFEALKDESPLSVIELATDYLAELLARPSCRKVLEEYALRAIDNIKAGHSVTQSYKLLMLIVDTLPQPKVGYATNPRGDFLAKIERDAGELVRMLLDEFLRYFEVARAAAAEVERPFNAVLQGKHTHRQQITGRLKFLEYLLTNSKGQVSFNIEDFKACWELFTVHSVTPKDTRCFLRWLFKGRDQRLLYAGKLLVEIFEEFFVKEESLPAGSLSMTGYRCFERHFLVANFYSRKLELKGNLLKSRTSSEVRGYPKLLLIAMSAQDEAVAKSAVHLIVSLHKRLGEGLDKHAIWSELINDCLGFLAGEDDLMVTRALRLMLSLIDEGRDGVELPPTSVLYVSSTIDRDYIKLPINLQETIGALRKKIAERYKKPLASVRVIINGISYDDTDDDLRLDALKAFNICFVDFIAEAAVASAFDGVHLLAESQQLMDSLFELVSRPNKAYSEEAWSLLTQLPMNPKIKSAIQDFVLSVPEILDNASIHHLLYCLLIVNDLLQNESLDWLSQFAARNGVSQIVRVYLETECSEGIGASMACKYYATIIQLLDSILSVSACEAVPQATAKTLEVLGSLAKQLQQGGLVDEEEAAAVLRSSRKLLDLFITTGQQVFIDFKDWGAIVEGGLINCPSERLSFAFADLLNNLSSQELALNSLLLPLIASKLPRALTSQHSDAYFILAAKLSQHSAGEVPHLDSSIGLLLEFIRQHTGEKSSKETDNVLKGAVKLLTTLMQFRPQIADEGLLDLVLHASLFEAPGMSAAVVVPPKCKSSDTRKEALELLLLCCKSNPHLLEATMKYLQKLLEDPSWRTGRTADWNYAPSTLEKSTTGFVGLKNLGCTCYMNSTLQQLFMIPSFREGVVTSPLTSEEPPAENLMYQLQYMFTALERSEKQSVNPKGFLKAYKDWEGNPINPLEQMDAYEFFITFLDKVENFVKGTDQHLLVQDHFGGVQTTEIIGQDNCSHTSERNEPYLTLNVEVKNKKTLQESLESFCEGELLEGDNAYECERCEGKVSAVRRVCIKQLPNVLIVVMRRFAFDFDTMARLKLNDYCEFPIDLDMQPYTQEGLRRSDQAKRGEELDDLKFPREYYQYRLKGIVVHMGTADSGHYYSFIQDRKSDNWIEFNDKLVKDFDPSDIPSEAFGGEERWSWGNTSLSSMREKFRNAYMLVYERDTFFDPKVPEDEGALKLLVRPKTTKTDDSLNVCVREDNERLWRCKSSFSTEYLDFIHHFVQLEHPAMPKFLISFMLTTLFRAKEKPKLSSFVKKAKGLLQRDAALSSWLLEVITVDPVLKELLLDCPVAEMRVLTVGLAALAASQVPSEEAEAALRRLVSNLHLARSPASKCFSHFFMLMNKLLSLTTNLPELQLFERLYQHFIGANLKPTKFPAPFLHSDIYLGYDRYKPNSARQERFFLEEGSSSMAYLIEVLLTLLPAQEPSKLAILQDSEFISKLSFEATTKRGADSLGRIYHYLSRDQAENAAGLISFVFKVVTDYDAPWAPIFMRQLKPLIRLESASYSERLNFLMNEFVKAAKASVKYYKTMIECINWLLKTAALYPNVRNWVIVNVNELKWLETYLSQYLYPPTSSATTATRTATGVQPVAKSNAGKLDALKKLLRNSPFDLTIEYDSDDELPNIEVKIGSKIDAKDPTGTRWSSATVLQSTGELLLLKFDLWGDKYNKWVEKSSDALAPLGTKSKA
jgi:ubiquitin carboxyl-terminal hydrolase 9/24